MEEGEGAFDGPSICNERTLLQRKTEASLEVRREQAPEDVSDMERCHSCNASMNRLMPRLAIGALFYLIILCHEILYRIQDQQLDSDMVATSGGSQSVDALVRVSSRDLPQESSGSNRGSVDISPLRILIVYGPHEDPWQSVMARAVQEGCQSNTFTTEVAVKTVANATFQDVLASDAIVLGSSVENANTHPAVQQWVDEQWNILQVDGNNTRIGAAFVTAGGISAGQESTLHNLLRSLMIFRMVIVGGETWGSAFGAAAITGEAPFVPVPDGDSTTSTNGGFPLSCYLKPGELIAPMFLDQARGLGARVARVARQLKA